MLCFYILLYNNVGNILINKNTFYYYVYKYGFSALTNSALYFILLLLFTLKLGIECNSL